jgi:NAD(P)-dependent dehydrogenase (short-subunit alcohol dehydrogenase family)
MQFKNDVVLMCGGASGIGAETARKLGKEGARVVIGDINLEGAESVATELTRAGAQAIALHYDQSDEASINELVMQSIDHFGHINGVFANAADLSVIHQDADVLSNDTEIWSRTLQVNLTGYALIIKATLPHLLSLGGGSIVCTSSAASVVGEDTRPAYAASKAGVNALVRHVASRWGKQNIRCNAIAPGFVVTETIEKNFSAEELQKMLRYTRAARLGECRDIAAMAALLLSSQGEWINGQVLHVNGGVHYGN